MFFRLFLIFAAIPVIEIYLLIQVGRVIGPLPTVLVLLAISAAGAWLVRAQGFYIARRIRSELAAGHLPAEELFDSFLVLVGGLLLMTPGFFTDFIGLFFLIPFTRFLIKRSLRRWLDKRLAKKGAIVVTGFRRH